VALGGLALTLGIVSQPASATSTAGWSQADRSAATVREFQTRLMVAALRCRAAGIDVLASYNQFIAADRAEIAAANDRLKVHFKSASPASGDRDYDRYTTSLANGFAGEQWSPDSCDGAARLAREAARSSGNLLAVAARDTDLASLASSAPPQWSASAADSAPAPQAYANRGPPQAHDDRTPPPGYDDRGPQRYSGDWQAPQAYDDRGPPPGYYDQSPSSRDHDGWGSQQAYNDQSPPPGYYDRVPPSGYDDRDPPPGYDDRDAPRGYGGY